MVIVRWHRGNFQPLLLLDSRGTFWNNFRNQNFIIYLHFSEKKLMFWKTNANWPSNGAWRRKFEKDLINLMSIQTTEREWTPTTSIWFSLNFNRFVLHDKSRHWKAVHYGRILRLVCLKFETWVFFGVEQKLSV